MNIKKLANPPIIEAILDIDCDMPVDFRVGESIKPATEIYQDHYPQLRKKYLQQHEFEVVDHSQLAKSTNAMVDLQSLLLTQDDGKQLVQVRKGGFSFNRLQPYTTLDDYLGEMERTWLLFVGAFKPIQVQRVKLRYVNRIYIPLNSDYNVDLDEYFTVGPQLIDDNALEFVSFLHHHQVMEKATRNMGKIILASQPVVEQRLPVLFDIEVMRPAPSDTDWAGIRSSIDDLRRLKNEIFHNSLKDKCKKTIDQ